jgi:putative aminopeptidase FrvX
VVAAHQYSQTDTDPGVHADADADAYHHLDADCDSDLHLAADLHADGHLHAHGYTHKDCDTHAHADGDVHPHAHCHTHRHSDGDDYSLSLVGEELPVETIPLLTQLSEAVSLSGHEASVRQLLRTLWAPLVDEVREEGLGSLVGLQRGTGPEPRPRLMLAAHMDEIGLRVTGIEKGFLRVTAVGGADRRVMPGTEVTVHGRQDLPGVVGMRPPHVIPPEQRGKPVPWEELFVDVGLEEGEVLAQVTVGDPVSFRRDLVELRGGLVAGKALDNRASVAALTLALERLSRTAHAWDVVAVATVQEEIGLYGAATSAYGVAPDLAVALDVTYGQQKGVSDDLTFPLGEGPTIGVGPNFHPALVGRLKAAAKAQEIPYHVEPVPGHSGTDAWAIQVSREGIPTGLVSIPVRYMHQPVETGAVKDVERTGRLLEAFVAGLEADFRPRWEDEV